MMVMSLTISPLILENGPVTAIARYSLELRRPLNQNGSHRYGVSLYPDFLHERPMHARVE